MKKILLMVILNVSNAFAGSLPPVGSGFNYQGELINNGVVVNGLHDFKLQLFTAKTGGVPSSNSVTKSHIMVTNGMFYIENIDFGDNVYIGSEQWLQIRVKPNSSATFTTLSPLQRVGAVPYSVQAEFVAADAIGTSEIQDDAVTNSKIANGAINSLKMAQNAVFSSNIVNNTIKTEDINNSAITSLKISEQAIGDREIADESISGGKIADNTIKPNNFSSFGATNGDVFQFDGTNWVTTALSGGSSPWTVNGSDINYQSGKVAIGTDNVGARLFVQGPAGGGDLLRVRLGGSTKFYIDDNGGTSIGNYVNPPTNGLRVEGNSYFVGKVGVDVQNPTAKFEIRSDAANENPFVVKTGSLEKFVVNDNGGSTIGSSSTPPQNGLKVDGNIKQPIGSNGALKYMVHANCFSSSPTIVKSYDGVTSNNSVDQITISSTSPGCVIEFPDKVNERYWQASLAGGSAILLSAKCYLNSSNDYQLYCLAMDGVGLTGGVIMLLVY